MVFTILSKISLFDTTSSLVRCFSNASSFSSKLLMLLFWRKRACATIIIIIIITLFTVGNEIL